MNLLSIGGSDPSSGAGIQGDIKTFTTLKAYGVSTLTAITSQNTSKFGAVEPVSSTTIKNQLDAIFSDFRVDGIKIGMVYNSQTIRALYDKLKNFKVPIVLDPVIQSTTGGILLKKAALNDFKKFLVPLATVITPNKMEAEILSGTELISENSISNAAKIIQKLGVINVVITGLELKKDRVSDFVLDKDNHYLISGKKFSKGNHGGGCNYSASMIFALASGFSLIESVKFSKHFTENSIKNSVSVGDGIQIAETSSRDAIRTELTDSINKLLKLNGMFKRIPECQTNFVFSKKNPKSIKDVLGISGRIVKTGRKISLAGNLSYGGSKHVATALISVNKKFSHIRSAINLKYEPQIISQLKEAGFIFSKYARNKEPKIVKDREGLSIEWGITEALKNCRDPPDVIFHTGDLGKEPMIIIFAETPSKILQKILKLYN